MVLLITGCAVRQSLSGSELKEMQDRFDAGKQGKSQCRSMEADATVTFKALWREGSVPGFVMAKAPAMIKFVGLTPFGQPVVLLRTDGHDFEYIDVLGQKIYRGDLAAADVAKYLPAGMLTEKLYAVITGQLLDCDYKEIQFLPGEAEGYQADFRCSGSLLHHRYFFDAEDTVRRYRQIQGGETLVDISFGSFSGGKCNLPQHVVLKNHGIQFELQFENFLVGEEYGDKEFLLPIPAGYEKISIH